MCVCMCVCECVSGGGVRVGCMERMGEGGMRGEGKVRVGCVTVDLDNLSLLLGSHSDTALRDPAEGRRRSGTHCLCMCVNFPNFQGKHYILVLLRVTITNDDE